MDVLNPPRIMRGRNYCRSSFLFSTNRRCCPNSIAGWPGYWMRWRADIDADLQVPP